MADQSPSLLWSRPSWPRRIYKRRKPWHWLADAGAPFWLWSLFSRDRWRRCSACGLRGLGRWKPAASYGGGLPPRHYCTTSCGPEPF